MNILNMEIVKGCLRSGLSMQDGQTAILEKKPADQAVAEIGEKVQAILDKNK